MDSTSAVSIIFVISIVIILVFIIFFIYYSNPANAFTYEIYLFFILFIFVIAIFAIYLLVYNRPNTVPFGVIVPPVSTGITYGGSYFLNTAVVGTQPCSESSGVVYLESSSLSGYRFTLGGGTSGSNLIYGNTISLVSNDGISASILFQNGNYRVYFPPSGATPLVLTVLKSPDNTSSSNFVLIGDSMILTTTGVDPSSPDTVYKLTVNTSDTGTCGNHLDLIPTAITSLGPSTFQFAS